MSKIDDFVGVPFRDKGRDRAGCDCWGLYRLVLLECCGISLPSYDGLYVTADDRIALGELISNQVAHYWRAIRFGEEKSFDGVLMTEAGIPRHIGIVVRAGFVLHIENEQSAVIESYRGPRLARRIAGIYRHIQQS